MQKTENSRYGMPVPGFIGPSELLLLLIVALVVFGPKRLPEIGRSLGKGMRDFKNAISGDDWREPAEQDVSPRQLESGPSARRDTIG